MQPEIEAKFLDADHNELRAKLKSLGAKLVQPMRLTKRKNFDFADGRLDDQQNGWVRLRDSGDKITVAYKRLDNRSLNGTHEVSTIVESFEATEAFLKAIGLKQTSYQETKRESWQLDGCEIELDVWPWLKPYVEIEGLDEAAVKACAAKLGLDWEHVCHGSVEIAYQAEYDVTDREIDDLPVITFETPLPELLERKRRV